jgi:PAS domain S-box-containing protein
MEESDLWICFGQALTADKLEPACWTSNLRFLRGLGRTGDISIPSLSQLTQVSIQMGTEQARLRAILDNSYDAFISMNLHWCITDWNRQAERTFGWRKAEVIGRNLSMIIPSHLRKQYFCSLEDYFSNNDANILKTSRELFAIHRDGHEVPIEIGIFRIQEDSAYVYCAYIRDVAKRVESTEELEKLVQERTRKLTQSNDELRQFAKITSHDLQEPLRAIQGFANLLQETSKGKLDKDSAEFVDFILEGTQRMQRLVNSVLVHSQINVDDSAHYATNCNSVIEEVLADMNEVIEKNNVNLEVDRLPRVAVERSQVAQLFQNLIGNAIKYRKMEKLLIRITAERNWNQWLFSVSDNSIGIDSKYTEKIFDMFSRLHSKTAYPGTGMGLAICKRIVTSHGGNIWVESKLGQGSIFFFTLPTVKRTRRTKMKEAIQILLVEDTPSDIRLTEEALKRSELNYEMVVVNDGVEAMHYLIYVKGTLAKRMPDIILLDLNMPRKNGHEVLGEIKNDPDFRAIPVVLLTVSERHEDVMEALRSKMNYYVAKPVTSQKLSTIINAIHELQTQQPGELDEHTKEENHIRLVLAGNPHTSAITLTKLADDINEKVRRRVAENANTPIEVLALLAKDASSEVRMGVSENQNVPAAVLQSLAEDQSDEVRLELSGNPNTPVKLLERLAEDANVYVSSSASKTLQAKD